jgi:F-type H+-transporting ATPase subunit beta
MVYGQMNEPPGNRLRVARLVLTGDPSTTKARCLVLCRQHLSLHLGWHRSASTGSSAFRCDFINDTGAEEMGRCKSASRRLKKPVRSHRFRPFTIPADDVDPSPATTFTHLDSTVVLSRDIAGSIYPAG